MLGGAIAKEKNTFSYPSYNVVAAKHSFTGNTKQLQSEPTFWLPPPSSPSLNPRYWKCSGMPAV